MSNSPLATYVNISPNKTVNRNHVIDTVSIHCVVGQCCIEALGNLFAQASKKASSNYGIGKDGKIGMFVEEKDRSWCTSSASNDNRAVTIEVASDTKDPYAVTDAAYNSLIKLLADICKRNNIKKLLWKGDKSLIGQVDKQNMTVHRWFANKACPGDYLYNRHGEIAEKVNALLGQSDTPAPAPVAFKPYIVRVTSTVLNIRSGPGTNYTTKGRMIPGAYTIVEESKGQGATMWGKLKSGAGWISLDYATKI